MTSLVDKLLEMCPDPLSSTGLLCSSAGFIFWACILWFGFAAPSAGVLAAASVGLSLSAIYVAEQEK